MGTEQPHCDSHGLLADFFGGGWAGGEGGRDNHCSHLQY